jgi:sugar phosphate isomerase/epimerase
MFRLGSTSYVYPADLVTNARRLAGVVRDIELILFNLPTGESNLPDRATVATLAEIAALHDLTYTVHLPLDLYGENAALALAARVIDITAPLTPYGYVFHIEHRDPGTAEWYEAGVTAIEALLPLVPTPTLLCLENLESYPPDLLEPFFGGYPIACALDIGHLWKAGLDPFHYLHRWLPHARVIHLHGVEHTADPVRDHLSLAVMDKARIEVLLPILKAYEGVLTLEVFEDDFWNSLAVLREVMVGQV